MSEIWDRANYKNRLRVKIITNFWKKIQLRCFAGFWIRLCFALFVTIQMLENIWKTSRETRRTNNNFCKLSESQFRTFKIPLFNVNFYKIKLLWRFFCKNFSNILKRTFLQENQQKLLQNVNGVPSIRRLNHMQKLKGKEVIQFKRMYESKENNQLLYGKIQLTAFHMMEKMLLNRKKPY